MSTNRFAAIDFRINSCLMGNNCYKVISDETAFEQALLEEISDSVRQTPGRSYMQVRLDGSDDELWMVPFSFGEAKTNRFLDTMEEVLVNHMGKREFHFPVDVVSDQDTRGYIMKPINREMHQPLRTFMPSIETPRWKIADSLFRRVREMHDMGITSNGLSREQMRVRVEDHEVEIWLNETMSLLEEADISDTVSRHVGFFSIPEETEKQCQAAGIRIDSRKRDIFSAALAAFYLILYTHPFVGSAFYGLMRSDYLMYYQYTPRYILEEGSSNNLGNQLLSRIISDQWENTVPELKALFDGIFLAVSHPDSMWDDKAAYWDVQEWIRAIDKDAKANDNPNSRVEFHFENEMYHLV